MNNDMIIYNKIFCICKLTQIYVQKTIRFIYSNMRDPEENGSIAKVDIDELSNRLVENIKINGIATNDIVSVLNKFFIDKEAGLECDEEFIDIINEIINNDNCRLCNECMDYNNECPYSNNLGGILHEDN